MRAIVLSGGGSKGSYEIGFWKAIRRLNIKYDIVTGTSVGALNGALMVQKDYLKALFLWHNLKYEDIFEFDKKKYSDDKIIELYKANLLKGGVEVTNLENTISRLIRPTKFFSSNVKYGLITVKVPSLKHVEMTKKNLNEKNLKDFLVASASCFPAFKIKKIDDQAYIDGGFYDNLPINLAVKLGADEVIAIDLDEIGIKRKIKYDVPVTYITPRNDIGSFLKFEKNSSRRGIRLGYNDTMKIYNYLDGDKYTFKKDDLNKNFSKYKKSFIKNIELITNGNDKKLKTLLSIVSLNKIYKSEKLFNKEFNKIIEKIGYLYMLDDSNIYSIKKYNKIIINKFKKIISDNNKIEENIKNNKLKLLLNDKEMISYLYELIEMKEMKRLQNLCFLFPNEFLMTIYLKTIIEG